MSELGHWFLLFLVSGLFAVVCGAYRLCWTRRYESLLRSASRVRGEVVGPGPRGAALHCGTVSGRDLFSRPLELRARGGREHRILPGGAVLSGPSLRHPRLGSLRVLSVGDRITVDGLPVPRARAESHYREQSAEEWLEAVRISPGTWPELRWLRVPIAIAAVLCLTGAVALLFAPAPPHTCSHAEAAPPILSPSPSTPLPILHGAGSEP